MMNQVNTVDELRPCLKHASSVHMYMQESTHIGSYT